jgi:hypothetical protein
VRLPDADFVRVAQWRSPQADHFRPREQALLGQLNHQAIRTTDFRHACGPAQGTLIKRTNLRREIHRGCVVYNHSKPRSCFDGNYQNLGRIISTQAELAATDLE